MKKRYLSNLVHTKCFWNYRHHEKHILKILTSQTIQKPLGASKPTDLNQDDKTRLRLPNQTCAVYFGELYLLKKKKKKKKKSVPLYILLNYDYPKLQCN